MEYENINIKTTGFNLSTYNQFIGENVMVTRPQS